MNGSVGAGLGGDEEREELMKGRRNEAEMTAEVTDMSKRDIKN